MVSSNETLLYELEEELHELCQPLTALHFRLELGKSDGSELGLREAVDGALEETARLIESIRRMRDRVTALKAAERLPHCEDTGNRSSKRAEEVCGSNGQGDR